MKTRYRIFLLLIFCCLFFTTWVACPPTVEEYNDDDDSAGDDDDETDDDTTTDDDDATDDDDDDDNDDDDFNCDGDVCTDSSSGLMWQNDSRTELGGSAADNYCNYLNWGGYGDWRVPSVSELRSLVRGCPDTETGGSCGVTDSCLHEGNCWTAACNGCPSDLGPGTNGVYWPAELQGGCEDLNCWYWSSSIVAEASVSRWCIGFEKAQVADANANSTNVNLRCVR